MTDTINNNETITNNNETVVTVLTPSDAIKLVEQSNVLIEKLVKERLTAEVKKMQVVVDDKEDLLRKDLKLDKKMHEIATKDDLNSKLKDAKDRYDKDLATEVKGNKSMLDKINKDHANVVEDLESLIEVDNEAISALHKKAKKDFRAVVARDFDNFITYVIDNSLAGWKHKEHRLILTQARAIVRKHG